jgi:hypothetical protein
VKYLWDLTHPEGPWIKSQSWAYWLWPSRAPFVQWRQCWYIKGRTKSVFCTINQSLIRLDAKQINRTAIKIYRNPLHYIRTGNNRQHATWRYHQTPAIMQVSVPSSQPCSVWRIAAGGAENVTSHNRSKDTRFWNYRSVCMHDKDLWASVHCQMTSLSRHTPVAVQITVSELLQYCSLLSFATLWRMWATLPPPPISTTRHQLLRVQSWVSPIHIFITPWWITRRMVGQRAYPTFHFPAWT